jgi:hypothetical protein
MNVKRHVAAAVITAAVAVGLLDPYACRQYSLHGAHAEPAAAPAASASALAPADEQPLASRLIPKRERARLREAAEKALALLPVPRGYVLDPESNTFGVGETAPWDEARATWSSPGAASAERVYEPRKRGENAPPNLEQRVYVNSEVRMPSGLASEGTAPRPFPIQGAPAVGVTTICMEGAGAASSEGGRVAMPVTPDQAASAITIIRVLLADPKTERIYRSAAAVGGMPEGLDRAAKRPGAVQSLVIELYGGKRDVEALARRLPVAALRKLLDPR